MRWLLGCMLLLGVFVVVAPHSGARGAKHHLSGACSVVAFGDSITWGAYATYNQVAPYLTSARPVSAHRVGTYDTSYPGDLVRALHVSVCNFGIPGELALQGRPRLHQLLGVLQPRLIVILEGVNDLASERSQSDVLNDLWAMVEDVQRHHVHPMLATLVPTYYPAGDAHHDLNGQVRSLNRAIRQLARRKHVVLADVEAAFLHDRRGVKLTKHGASFDYLHPNDTGYRVLAGAVTHVVFSRHLLPLPRKSAPKR